MLYDPNTYKGIKGGTAFEEHEFYASLSNKAPKSKSTQSNARMPKQTTESKCKLYTKSAEKSKFKSPNQKNPVRVTNFVKSSSVCSINCEEYITKIKNWNQQMTQKIAKTQQSSPPKKGILEQCIDVYMKKQQVKQMMQ